MAQQRSTTTRSKTTTRARDRSIAQTIKQVLELDDQEYAAFYAFVAAVFKTSRFAGRSFSTIERKAHIKVEVFNAVLRKSNQEGRFDKTVILMQTDAGREAFQKLVYRINANIKRQGDREHRGLQSKTMASPSVGSSDENERDGPASVRPIPTNSQCHVQLDTAVWVTLRTGAFKAVCLARDITREDITASMTVCRPKDLQLSRLQDLLAVEYGFDQKTEHLELDQEQEKPAMIDNQSDWERLILIRRLEGKSLKFLIVCPPLLLYGKNYQSIWANESQVPHQPSAVPPA
jgi:hypothetical protein